MDFISYDELDIICSKMEKALVDSSFTEGMITDLSSSKESLSIRYRDAKTRNEFKISYDGDGGRILIYDRKNDKNHIVLIYKNRFFKIWSLDKNCRRLAKLKKTIKNRESLKKQREISEACSVIHATYPEEVEKVLLK